MHGSQTIATTQELSWQAEADTSLLSPTHTAHCWIRNTVNLHAKQGELASSHCIVDLLNRCLGQWFFSQYCKHLLKNPVRADFFFCCDRWLTSAQAYTCSYKKKKHEQDIKNLRMNSNKGRYSNRVNLQVIGASVSEPHTSEQCVKKFFVLYIRTYVRSGNCSNYAEVTSGSYFASSCVIH